MNICACDEGGLTAKLVYSFRIKSTDVPGPWDLQSCRELVVSDSVCTRGLLTVKIQQNENLEAEL
jgi:hypothetical protein